jgi:hypothetical protein
MSAARSNPARSKSSKPKSTAPVQLKKRSAVAPREALFSVDDVEYTMPASVPLGDALTLTTLLRVQPDEDAKRMLLVRELCGSHALHALLGDATMTRAEWDTIGKILTEKVFGPLEAEVDGEGN